MSTWFFWAWLKTSWHSYGDFTTTLQKKVVLFSLFVYYPAYEKELECPRAPQPLWVWTATPWTNNSFGEFPPIGRRLEENKINWTFALESKQRHNNWLQKLKSALREWQQPAELGWCSSSWWSLSCSPSLVLFLVNLPAGDGSERSRSTISSRGETRA